MSARYTTKADSKGWVTVSRDGEPVGLLIPGVYSHNAGKRGHVDFYVAYRHDTGRPGNRGALLSSVGTVAEGAALVRKVIDA